MNFDVTVLLAALRKLGFAADAKNMSEKWCELVGRMEPICPPERRCL
jgi:hypothetical protein